MAEPLFEFRADLRAPSEFPSSEMVPLGRTSIDGPARLLPCVSIAAKPESHRKLKNRQVPVVIIDKSELYRVGLKHALPSDRYRVVGEYSFLDEVSPILLKKYQCLMLVGVDDVSDLLSTINKMNDLPISYIVTLSYHRPDREELFSFIAAGSDSYLIKDEITEEMLLKTLDLVLLGGSVIPRRCIPAARDGVTAGQALSEEIPAGVEAPRGTCEELQPSNSRLTEREQAILMRLTHGASNKHIARDLDIAEATVKVHVKSVLRKLRVQNRTQAAMRAHQELRLPQTNAQQALVRRGAR